MCGVLLMLVMYGLVSVRLYASMVLLEPRWNLGEGKWLLYFIYFKRHRMHFSVSKP